MKTMERIPRRPDLSDYMKTLTAPKEGVSVYWLGQAGFYFITAEGTRIAIDPYLTEFCDRVVGFRRMMAPVMSAQSFDCDLLLISHAHEDHCDLDLLAAMAEQGRKTKVLYTHDCASRIEGMQLDKQEFNYGDKLCFRDVTVTAVKCDHGDGTPYAVGYILEIGDKTIYFAGDTCLNQQGIREIRAYAPQLALLPVNGEYGNLNGVEAGRLAQELRCEYLIPCHFWMFVEHGAFPLELKRHESTLCPDVKVIWLTQGEGAILKD